MSGRSLIGILVMGLAAVCVVPVAYAGTSITVATATTRMTDTPSSQTPVSVGCPTGSTLIGGGFRDYVASDGDANETIPTNGLTMHGTYPSDANANAAANGSTNPADWTAMGGFAAVAEAGDDVTAFAMCATGGPTQIEVVTDTVDGPQVAATTDAATVTCPSGTSLVGGGGLTNDGTTQPSYKVIGSFPSSPGGASSTDGATDPDSWTALGAAGGVGSGANTTTVYALCATGSFPTIVARTDDLNNPQEPTTFVTASATCPSGTVLIGGGAEPTGNATDGDSGTPQQGVHVRGTYPSDSGGNAVGDGAGGVQSWTVIVQSGGQDTPGTDTHVWALCLGTDTSGTAPAAGETQSSASGGAGPGSGGTGDGTAASATAGSGGATATSPSGLHPTGHTALLIVPTIEATRSTTVKPGAAGSMTVGSGSQSVNVGWTTEGLGKRPLKLTVSFTAFSAPRDEVKAVTSAAITLTVKTASGRVVSQLGDPLNISFPGAASNVIPAFSSDGTRWTRIPQLSSANMPSGLSDGYYRDTLGALHILTLHVPRDFGLLTTSEGLDITSEPLAFTFRTDETRVIAPGAKLRILVSPTAAGNLTLTLHLHARTLVTWHEKLAAAARLLSVTLPSGAQVSAECRLVLTLSAGGHRVVHGQTLLLEQPPS